jgi:RNA polymerase sigma-70 factor, ECF subfamily
MPSSPLLSDASVDDAELARRIGCDDERAFESLMRRNNGSLFRVARAILKNAADAEDVLQEAYLAAYRHIADFRADAKLSTWLTRIVINKALALRRHRHRDRVVVRLGEVRPDAPLGDACGALDEPAESPEQSTTRTDIRRLLERKIDELPVAFRSVFALRELEELSVAETAACLSIPEATVRSRLFRARGMLRESLACELDMATGDVFKFGGERCDRVVAGVLAQRRALAAAAASPESGNANAGRTSN